MYFSERKYVVEIDEKGHTDRNQNEENKRQINYKFFQRINPDLEGFDIFLELVKYKLTSLNQTKKI